MELSVDACKACVMQIAEGGDANFLMSDIVREYVLRVLDLDFVEHLPMLNYHYDVAHA